MPAPAGADQSKVRDDFELSRLSPPSPLPPLAAASFPGRSASTFRDLFFDALRAQTPPPQKTGPCIQAKGEQAMKFKSPVFSQASGSIAGITYSHNRGGLYVRARVVPTNPGSPFQMVIRGFVANLTSLWNNTLTAVERAAWDAYALAVPLLNTLGEPINVGGLAMYIRSNVPRLQAALPRVDVAPIIFNLGDFTNPTFDTFAAATNEFSVNFADTDDWANEDDAAMLILGSRPQNPSVNYFKGPYRFAGLIAGDAITPPTSPATLTSAFAFDVGQVVFLQARVTRADGRLTLPFRGNSIGA